MAGIRFFFSKEAKYPKGLRDRLIDYWKASGASHKEQDPIIIKD